MLNKDIDYALVGNNFITFLLSIGLLNRGKKILVLDDDRFNYDQFSTNALTLLDVEFLRNWGELSHVEPLQNIDQYVTRKSINYYVGKKQVALGDTPLRNYRELCRKFPDLFLNELGLNLLTATSEAGESFNKSVQEFSSKVTRAIFLEKKASKVNKIFETSIPVDLMTLFQHFFSLFSKKEELSEWERSEFNTLIFMTRGFFQNRLSTSGSRSEIMHLFISLLSPYFHLDHERLIQDLQVVHKAAGGEFKKLNLADLKFHSGLVTSFELESFQGLIRPKKMIFIGSFPEVLPIHLKTSSATYNCVKVTIEFLEGLPSFLLNKKILFSSAMKIGTDRPFWEATFNEKSATFNVITAKREGGKIDFIRERIIKLLSDDLAYLYPEYDFAFNTIDMNFTLDIFIEDKDYKANLRSGNLFGVNLAQVLEHSTPLDFSRLKNVLYFGHYNEDSLGTFSSMLGILRWRESL
jgi:hypothetical protein